MPMVNSYAFNFIYFFFIFFLYTYEKYNVEIMVNVLKFQTLLL